MGMFKLQLRTTPKGFEKLGEIRARLQDFSVPFASIIQEWAKGNARKFARSAGAELTGADQQLTTWAPVTEAYYKQKHGPVIRGERTLYPDWLMVRTGALRAALGTSGAFAEYISAKTASFGTPLDTDAAMAAWGNRKKRPTIFLDRTDRGVIRREMQRYLSMGEGYKQMLWAISGGKAAIMRMNKEMNVAFAQTLRV